MISKNIPCKEVEIGVICPLCTLNIILQVLMQLAKWQLPVDVRVGFGHCIFHQFDGSCAAQLVLLRAICCFCKT